MYRKKLVIIGAVVLALCLAGVAIPVMAKTNRHSTDVSPAIQAAPAAFGKASLTVYPAVCTGDNKTMKVTILGAGLEPGQEVLILMSMGGIATDVSYLMEPPAKANQLGAFAGVVDLSGAWREKLIEAGAQTLSAVDANVNLLATTPVLFVNPPPEKK